MSEDKVKVRFLRTEVYETEGFNKGPIFEQGSIHLFDRDFAERWIRRGAAEIVSDDAAAEAAAPAEPEAAAPAEPEAAAAAKAPAPIEGRGKGRK